MWAGREGGPAALPFPLVLHPSLVPVSPHRPPSLGEVKVEKPGIGGLVSRDRNN